MARNRYLKGFTLLELLVALALMGILLGVGFPNFLRMIEINRVVSATNEFKTAMNYARSEAVRRNQSVTLTPLPEGWSAGWQVASGSQALRYWPQSTRGLEIQVLDAAKKPISGGLAFNSLGRLQRSRPETVWISIWLGEQADGKGRCIRLEPSGLSRVQDTPRACTT
ncbi:MULTISPECIES: GspH/FimT family pseudopilin [unclassified Halomonas]|uniref:GspH/FimT family pseudopilin n=1 Tax=unclassified Halomonas TaxID=2609666 RepID=UPI0021E47F49|nr:MULTISPECIES: GspH/FimT family pseudopilin [unclassified Halomonas]UYF99636.1 GspH/FimT family pseudopilin [Halomonas sp. GD1P12]WNL39273.1 GspH/FimT family pseudopilin [Halomonas sp. PAMB 3232]WNL42614.1 GspH/FimT family pseudopilin [Halomonas sp. PAMB 3264]